MLISCKSLLTAVLVFLMAGLSVQLDAMNWSFNELRNSIFAENSDSEQEHGISYESADETVAILSEIKTQLLLALCIMLRVDIGDEEDTYWDEEVIDCEECKKAESTDKWFSKKLFDGLGIICQLLDEKGSIDDGETRDSIAFIIHELYCTLGCLWLPKIDNDQYNVVIKIETKYNKIAKMHKACIEFTDRVEGLYDHINQTNEPDQMSEKEQIEKRIELADKLFTLELWYGENLQQEIDVLEISMRDLTMFIGITKQLLCKLLDQNFLRVYPPAMNLYQQSSTFILNDWIDDPFDLGNNKKIIIYKNTIEKICIAYANREAFYQHYIQAHCNIDVDEFNRIFSWFRNGGYCFKWEGVAKLLYQALLYDVIHQGQSRLVENKKMFLGVFAQDFNAAQKEKLKRAQEIKKAILQSLNNNTVDSFLKF